MVQSTTTFRRLQVFAVIFQILGVISPFIGGVVIAFILYKPAFAFEKIFKKSKKRFIKNRARGLSVLSCYLGLATILAVILYLLLPPSFYKRYEPYSKYAAVL